jgi:hypothetical protein
MQTAMNPMRMRVIGIGRWMAVAVLFGHSMCCLASAPGHSERTYRNNQFGFTLEVPFYAPACDPQLSSENTGITFFLDAGAPECNAGMDDRPFISVHFTYNTPEYPDSHTHLTSNCDVKKNVRPTSKEFGILAKRWPMMCEYTKSNGMLVIELAGESPKKSGQNTPSFLHEAQLQTSKADRPTNIRTFIDVLESLKTF